MAIDIANAARKKKDPTSFRSVAELELNEAFDAIYKNTEPIFGEDFDDTYEKMEPLIDEALDTIRKYWLEINMERENERRNKTTDK